MDWLYPIVLRVIAAVALIYFGLGLFNVPWLLRVRIIASLAIGGLVIGAISYRLVRPVDPLGAITLFTGEICVTDAIIIVFLGFVSGVAATLVCYPLGRTLGPFAAAAGVAVLAMSGGSLRQILLTHSSFDERNALYGFLRWELMFWLAVYAAGYAGVLLATKLLGTKKVIAGEAKMLDKKPSFWTNWGMAAFAAAAIVYFTIGIFAQDIRQMDDRFGFVVGQPGPRQIAFGVFISVTIAGFATKYFLQTHFVPVILGAAAIYIGMYTKIIGSDTMQYMVNTWPIYFYTNSIYSILPVQFVSFSALGASTGYWIAIYMKHHSNQP